MRMMRRLRSSFGIGSSRMAIRSQLAWYWRWLLNILMMVLVATVVWWLVQNSYRITGFDIVWLGLALALDLSSAFGGAYGNRNRMRTA